MKKLHYLLLFVMLCTLTNCEKTEENFTPENKLEFTLMTNKKDSQFLEVIDSENNKIEVYGTRDAYGLPIKIDQLLVKNQLNEEQLYLLDDLMRPTRIIANNGTQFELDWLNETQFVLSVFSIDGETQINTFVDLEEAEDILSQSNKLPSNGIRKGNLKLTIKEGFEEIESSKNQSTGNIRLNTFRCGVPVEVSNPRIVIKNINGDFLKTVFPNRIDTGVFEATIPNDLSESISGNEICSILESMLGNICTGYSIGAAAYGPLICAAISTAISTTGIGTTVALPIFEACNAMVVGLEIYCSTIGASPIEGAPSIAEQLCSAELLNFVFNDNIKMNASIPALPTNIISGTVEAPTNGPYPDINMNLGFDTFISGFSISPIAPQDGQDYDAVGNLICLKAGLEVNLSVVGSDGYTDEINYIVPSDMTEGQYILTVPGADTGVRDICTLRTQTLSGDIHTKTSSIVFGN